MKNIHIPVLLSIAALLVIQVGAATIDAISLYNVQFNPSVVVAGTNVTITFQLYDTYTQTLQNINLELQGSYPILNFSPTNPYIISSMGSGLYGGLNSYFTYVMRIPKSAPSGNYTLNLVAVYQTTQSSTTVTGSSTMPITFYVHGIPGISINPAVSQISPGSTATLVLTVMNSGYGMARNITVNALNSSGFTVAGTKRFVIASLAPGASSSISASYITGRYLTNGTYSIPVSVAYYSDQGVQYSQTINQTISVAIQNPNVVATIASATPQTLYSGYNQSLVLSIQNIGLGSANNVSVSITPNPGISVLSSVRAFFIGSLPAGQSVNENLLVSSSNYTGSTASVVARMNYYSANYKNHLYKNQTLNLSVAQSSIFQIAGGTYSITPGQTSVPIRLSITNAGNIDASQIQLSFQSSYPITPVSSSYYIADLQPGKSTNATFLVSVDSRGSPGAYPITIYETWRQPNSAAQQTYSGSNNYFAAVGNSAQNGGGLLGYAVAAIIVVVVAYLLIRRRLAMLKTGGKKSKRSAT